MPALKRLMTGAVFAFSIILMSGLIAGSAHAEWLKAESEHFIIYGDTSRGAIRDYTRKVERYDAMLRLFLPPEREDLVAPKLSIYIANSSADLRKAWPGVNSNIAGYYSRGDERIYAVVDRSRSEGDHTLFHEYGHHFMYQYHNRAYPAWFVEGFAEYFAPTDLTFGRIRYGLWSPGRMNSLTDTSDWIPMDQVLRSRPKSRTAQAGAAYYAQSWLLTHYMLGSPEHQKQFSAYLAAVQSGVEPMAALEQTVGRTPEQLGRDLQSYASRGITVYTLQQALPESEITVTALPPSARDFIWLDVSSNRDMGDDKDQVIARAVELAAKYPGDRLANVVVAKLQLNAKEPAAAEATITPVVAAHPDDAEAQWILATALMDQADALADDNAAATALTRRARAALGQAYNADPTDYRVYMGLARSRSGVPGYPNENDMVTLESAYRMAPQLGSTAYAVGRAMMAREKYPEAVMVLSPLANNPHGGESLNGIRTLLTEARQKAGLTPIDDDAPPPPPEGVETGDAAGA